MVAEEDSGAAAVVASLDADKTWREAVEFVGSILSHPGHQALRAAVQQVALAANGQRQ
jgi:hypothetical protein